MKTIVLQILILANFLTPSAFAENNVQPCCGMDGSNTSAPAVVALPHGTYLKDDLDNIIITCLEKVLKKTYPDHLYGALPLLVGNVSSGQFKGVSISDTTTYSEYNFDGEIFQGSLTKRGFYNEAGDFRVSFVETINKIERKNISGYESSPEFISFIDFESIHYRDQLAAKSPPEDFVLQPKYIIPHDPYVQCLQQKLNALKPIDM